MSFTPLPKIFADTCAALDFPQSQILEFGCGDGRFGNILAGLGLSCWGLDRLPPDCGTAADIVGEAAVPPVRDRSLDLLVVPNLLRHMRQEHPHLEFLGRWLDLLKPGGSLFIFEDEPGEGTPGQANYRDLQDFLARLLPESRGTLFPLEEFKAVIATLARRAAWEFGMVRNRETIARGPVLEMLAQGVGTGGESGRLRAAIEAQGLDPGNYWWARAVSGKEEAGN